MRVQLSKSQKIIFVLLLFLLVAGSAIAYFLYLQPLTLQVQEMQRNLKMEQKLLTIVQNKNTGFKKKKVENTTMLQKKLPVKPLIEQLLLNFEKAEVISESSIKSIDFTDESSQKGSTNPAAIIKNAINNAMNGNKSSLSGSPNSQAETPVTLPPGVKKITVKLSVESAEYRSFEKFVETIENSTRILVVESIDYKGANEITSSDGKKAPFTYNLTVSAFYMPEFKKMEHDAPKLDTPEGAGKTNPLSEFP